MPTHHETTREIGGEINRETTAPFAAQVFHGVVSDLPETELAACFDDGIES